MGRTKVKTFVGIISVLAWIFFLVYIKILKDATLVDPTRFSETSKILLFYPGIPIFFIWLVLGLPFGLPAFFITSIFIALLFESRICTFPLLSFVFMGYLGYRLNKIFENDTKNLEIDIEKMDEKLNLLCEETKSEENDNLRMRSSLARIAHLKNIIEDYSLTLSEEEVLNSIVKNTFELFEDANRALLYLVDTEKQELKLVRSKKRESHLPIRAKKGDVFDRWVLRQRTPLLVEDIQRDFRFSLKEELDKGFNSIISTPLTSEHKVLGILRIDSTQADKFTQSDLRFLDIIADLSSVSLQNSILYKKVGSLAIHDSLTGLYVHKYFIERLEEEVKRSLRNNMDISLLMLDLDNFKDYNDKYGHNAGDLVLKHIASILKSSRHTGDIISRYGGEEFTFLLLNRDKKAACEIAENIRKRISETPLVLRRKKTKITVSIGLASSPSEAKIAREFLQLVDSRLYKAKEKGRNRVCVK